jgi:hypothetical protein
MTAGIESTMGRAVSVRFEYVDDISPGPGGKFRFVIRE